MSHFAKIENGVVTQVIVADQDVIDSGIFGHGWLQTSFNTHGGKRPDGNPLRKNFAGVGYAYDEQKDAFIPPKPFPSWVLDEETCLWEPPVSYPTDIGTEESPKFYIWNEENLAWVERNEV